MAKKVTESYKIHRERRGRELKSKYDKEEFESITETVTGLTIFLVSLIVILGLVMSSIIVSQAENQNIECEVMHPNTQEIPKECNRYYFNEDYKANALINLSATIFAIILIIIFAWGYVLVKYFGLTKPIIIETRTRV